MDYVQDDVYLTDMIISTLNYDNYSFNYTILWVTYEASNRV